LAYIIERTADGKIQFVDEHLYDQLDLVKIETDKIPSVKTSAEVAASESTILEEHFHTWTRFLGARAGWDGTHEDFSAANDRLDPFTIDAGNNTWGTPLCIIGSEDTPVIAGMAYYDHRWITVTNTQRTQAYRVRFAYGSSYAAAIAAGTFAEWEWIALTGSQDTGPLQVATNRVAAGTKMFAACWCLGQASGTLTFTLGIHEYPA
jgi:hypothetical protein